MSVNSLVVVSNNNPLVLRSILTTAALEHLYDHQLQVLQTQEEV